MSERLDKARRALDTTVNEIAQLTGETLMNYVVRRHELESAARAEGWEEACERAARHHECCALELEKAGETTPALRERAAAIECRALKEEVGK